MHERVGVVILVVLLLAANASCGGRSGATDRKAETGGAATRATAGAASIPTTDDASATNPSTADGGTAKTMPPTNAIEPAAPPPGPATSFDAAVATVAYSLRHRRLDLLGSLAPRGGIRFVGAGDGKIIFKKTLTVEALRKIQARWRDRAAGSYTDHRDSTSSP